MSVDFEESRRLMISSWNYEDGEVGSKSIYLDSYKLTYW